MVKLNRINGSNTEILPYILSLFHSPRGHYKALTDDRVWKNSKVGWKHSKLPGEVTEHHVTLGACFEIYWLGRHLSG